jgi:translation initiation factor 2B subunit (eIF-2B alpha/beta/delta family)
VKAEEILATIAADRQHGASELTRRAALSLLVLAGEGAGPEEVKRWARTLVRAQPAMASLFALANEALWAAAGEWRKVAEAAIARLDRAMPEVVREAAKLLAGARAVLTHSHSVTVERALLGVGGSVRVLVTESLPVGEGRTLARQLQQAGLAVKVVADAEMYRAMSEVDLVVTGADAVTPEWVVNKVGTALLALAARERRRPFAVLCTSDKWVGEGWRAPEGGLFEGTPIGWVTWVVSEEGPAEAEEVKRRLGQMRVHELLADVVAELQAGGWRLDKE